MFTDEMWWDLVGPVVSKYCKGVMKMKEKCKTRFVLLCFVFMYIIFFLFIVTSPYHRFRVTKVKRVESKREFISGQTSRDSTKLLGSPGRLMTSR